MTSPQKPKPPESWPTMLAILSESVVLVSDAAEQAELGRIRTAEAWLIRSRRLMGAVLDLLEVEIKARKRRKK